MKQDNHSNQGKQRIAPQTRRKLTARELRFLGLIYPKGTVSVGLTVGAELHARGYLQIKADRYTLSRKGIIAVAASVAKPERSAHPLQPLG